MVIQAITAGMFVMPSGQKVVMTLSVPPENAKAGINIMTTEEYLERIPCSE
jgi:hypothetical protein